MFVEREVVDVVVRLQALNSGERKFDEMATARDLLLSLPIQVARFGRHRLVNFIRMVSLNARVP